MNIDVIDYDSQYAVAVADLFHGAVHGVDSQMYTPEQREAWAPTPPDYDKWKARLDIKKPFLAISDGRLLGFIELEADGHIDCLYTHVEFQRRGVAARLYQRLEREAIDAGMTRLYVEASRAARPFFESKGFVTTQLNEIQRNGQILVNFTMEKKLTKR
ncbi:GNAT family N-acetyltransferase [Hahella aquimaris]|uniref:GNAT family N-acetyltransferase n=1 Tax=Hahella sp. HNIBRBA332 TaxID=3015983 RepID=UPI00273C6130|nr:GNAT family N-acetyltransferase [Hahella sp. HNIBRBA332]WLQ12309.1 GNAT family N-acetyltransferase [Hahella sp. HNIBRBA332]